jgi:hypothetical protein
MEGPAEIRAELAACDMRIGACQRAEPL